jgi:hypothetical protein
MRHTEGMLQSVIMTRKLDYVAFCQGAIMTFDCKLRHYDVRQNGVRHSGMRQNTTPPKFTPLTNKLEYFSKIKLSA